MSIYTKDANVRKIKGLFDLHGYFKDIKSALG